LGLRGTGLHENGKDYTTRSFIIFTPNTYISKLEERYGVACVSKEEMCVLDFGGKT
jgi:hypothetical protein